MDERKHKSKSSGSGGYPANAPFKGEDVSVNPLSSSGPNLPNGLRLSVLAPKNRLKKRKLRIMRKWKKVGTQSKLIVLIWQIMAHDAGGDGDDADSDAGGDDEPEYAGGDG